MKKTDTTKSSTFAVKGDRCVSASTDIGSSSSAKGDCCAAVVTNEDSRATADGNHCVSVSTGTCCRSMANNGVAVSTHSNSLSLAVGAHGLALAAGENGRSIAGTASIAAAIGADSQAKGEMGSWLILAEWNGGEGGNGSPRTIKCIKAVPVDGNKIKPNTWYELRNGNIVAVDGK